MWEFFATSRPTYIGNLASVQPVTVAGHTYFTHGSDTTAATVRENVGKKSLESWANGNHIEVWSTEWCALGGGTGISTQNTYFDVGLFMAKLAYQDVVIAGTRTFSFWTALDMERGGFAKYSLIAYSPGVATYNHDSYQTNAITRPGAVKSQSTLWALGHYSRFVRPGFIRIGIDEATNMPANSRLNYHPGSDYSSRLMASAYRSPKATDLDVYTNQPIGPVHDFVTGKELDQIVIVYINMSTSLDYTLASDFSTGRKPTNIRIFKTDVNDVNGTNSTSNSNETGKAGMRRQQFYQGKPGVFQVPSRSMVTVVYDFN
jgi:hypothetical protein